MKAEPGPEPGLEKMNCSQPWQPACPAQIGLLKGALFSCKEEEFATPPPVSLVTPETVGNEPVAAFRTPDTPAEKSMPLPTMSGVSPAAGCAPALPATGRCGPAAVAPALGA